MKKISILFSGLSYLNHNYGAQGIALPITEKLDRYFDLKSVFTVSNKYYLDDKQFGKKYKYTVVPNRVPYVYLNKADYFDKILTIRYFYKQIFNNKNKYLISEIKKCDVILDISGIEFIGNNNFINKWLNYLDTIYIQEIAKKYNKLYLKYTKSYGPFTPSFYSSRIRKHLKELPTLFIRGEENLKQVKKLNLGIPLYCFPDISFALKPSSKTWAENYLKKIKINLTKPIIGISPSTVISNIDISNNNSAGPNHIKLCKELINVFRNNNQQILLIPHSIKDGEDLQSCDLALCKKIYLELENKNDVFLLEDLNLDYKNVRSIIGLLSFYITARYHSICSALYMKIPTICLSWHIKYFDLYSMFLDKFCIINCRTENVKDSIKKIKEYYEDISWFDKDKLTNNKKKVLLKIDKSIKLFNNIIENNF